MANALTQFLDAFWIILQESGLWLVAGFGLAGLVHVLVPVSIISKHLGGRGFWPVVKAALLGIPLPLCSCSVIPTAAGLRRQGAGKGATASFAISTPETGEESIALTWGLLGPAVALVRPLAAVITAISAGVLIDLFDADKDKPVGAASTQAMPAAAAGSCGCAPSAPVKSCCSTPVEVAIEGAAHDSESQSKSSCCLSGDSTTARSRGFVGCLKEAFRFGYIEMPRDLAPWLLVGLVLSGVISAFVSESWLVEHIGTGALPMLMMLVVGLPLYVCATSSTPVAAALVAKGLSPGAGLVFLLAGPATNMATMAWVLRDLGARALVIYLAVIAACAVAVGVAFDALVPAAWIRIPLNGGHLHGGSFGFIGGVLVALLLAVGIGVRLVRRKKCH